MLAELFGIYFVLAFVGTLARFLFDKKLYDGEECEYCKKLLEEKFGVKKRVFVVDETPKNSLAFVSRSGIYVRRDLLMPGREKILEAVLEHEVEHVKSHDVYKVLALKLVQYGMSAYMFFVHGFWWGLATAIVFGVVAFLFEAKREVSLASELVEKYPDVVEELKLLS